MAGLKTVTKPTLARQDESDSFPMASDLTYECALLFWRTVCNIFFREIRPRGAYNIPREGPVILVAAPHSNQFLDPILVANLVYKETKRRTRFLVAAVSLQRKVVGFFIRLMSSIPVARAADDAKPGKGLIYIDDSDPCLIRGHGTAFKEEFQPKMQIMLSKALNSIAAEVVEVISDTELRIKKEFGGESGKATAKAREKIEEARREGQRGLPYRKLPHVDQQVMFRYVYSCLKDGGCIGIFPEGGSHDRTDLLPLKAGVSLMALGAMASNPDCKVKIVPVGLSYFHAHKFRSRAVVEFGSAMDVPPDLVKMFKEGGDNKRIATQKLLDVIYNQLKTVTLRAPDYETLMVIQAARRLYNTPGQHLSLGQVVELNKRFLEGYLHFKDEPRIQALRTKVLKYNRLVRDLGLRDHQVPRAQRASWKILGLLIYRFGLLVVWTIFSLPGVIMNAPIFITAKLMSRQKAKEALAASNVKVAARDVVGTWKVLISLAVAPITYAIYAIIVAVIAAQAGASLKWRVLAPLMLLASLPFIGFAALKFGEAGMDVLKSLRPLIVSLAPGQQRSLVKLKKMRTELQNELADVINTFGPKYYEDFEDWRILVPKSKAAPSANSPPELRLRHQAQAGSNRTDGQGHLLVHPMTWLDERLFGWSKSSKRGTSAWAATPRSLDGSRLPTPESSEDEDGGDYDNVLGYLSDGYISPVAGRSRAGSYADLQKLKMTKNTTNGATLSVPTVVPGAAATTDHGRPRSGSVGSSPGGSPRTKRARGNSLTEVVPVEEINKCDKSQPFDEMTEQLNHPAHKTAE